MKNFLSFLFCISLIGCSDYKLSKIPEPDIVASPENIDYGAVLAGGDHKSAAVEVSNVGTGVLEIQGIALLEGDTTFEVSADYNSDLSPGETTEIIVRYSPFTYSINADKMRIFSNDPDEPTVDIGIGGSGDAPVIVVDPDYHSFLDVYVGCDDFIPVGVANEGNVDLEIYDINHLASLPADFSLYDYEPFFGMLPIVVPPSEEITLEIYYTPSDGYDDVGYIELTSNDPVRPIVHSDHDGDGDYEKWATDSFEQDETVDVDILFVIDNSGSMNTNQSNFKSNFSSFISVFSAAGVDYRIAFITTDDASFVNGQVISPTTPDPIVAVNDIVDMIGTTGSPNEKGLYQSYLSTTTGGDAAPGGAFFREDAKFVVIYVSDEPDHSTSSMSPSDYSSHFRGLKSSANLAVAHAVAGDYPGGCSGNGSAQFGDGYYDVVGLLGGTFLSICASDWGLSMDTLARESVAESTFILTEQAVEGTIEVEVNGVQSTDWFYDVSINAVQFTVIPPEGSMIDVLYAAWSCLGE